jgi:c-di-GMP-binding flagellar brake protein YcgR
LEKEKLSLTKNISKGGICLIAYEPLKPSDVLGLKMYLPGDRKEINAVGKVVWSKEFIIGDDSFGKRYDVGVEFIDVKDEDLNKVNKYVFSHISK